MRVEKRGRDVFDPALSGRIEYTSVRLSTVVGMKRFSLILNVFITFSL